MQSISMKSRKMRYLLLILGCFSYSLYAAILLEPNNIGTGGLLGIALVLNKLFGFKIGLTQLLLNIPLFIIGFSAVGLKFTFKTGVIVLISSVLIDNMSKFITVTPLDDKLVAAILCGLVSGFAMSMLFFGGGSTGGLDISGKALKSKFHKLDLSKILLTQDMLVYLFTAITLGASYVIYALVISFVRSKTIEYINDFFSASKQCIIICDCNKSEKLVNDVQYGLERGITILEATGGYTQKNKKFIYVIVQNSELYKLKKIVTTSDPTAFITISKVNTIVGNYKEHSIKV